MSANRRRFLNTLGLTSAGPALRSGRSQQTDLAPRTSIGGTDPYPIPWLDKNGSPLAFTSGVSAPFFRSLSASATSA
jgi:hypothetical protein